VSNDYEIRNIIQDAFVYELNMSSKELFCCSDKESMGDLTKEGYQISLTRCSSALVEGEEQIYTGLYNRVRKNSTGAYIKNSSLENYDTTSITDRIDELVRSFNGNTLIGSRIGLYEYSEISDNFIKVLDSDHFSGGAHS
jgi:hypothetical protein